MLRRMYIKKLFGRFEYDIVFKPEGVTIITGPNGFGKSTILKCIESMYYGDFSYFTKLSFEKIDIYFDEQEFNIVKSEDYLTLNNHQFTFAFITKVHNRMLARGTNDFIRIGDNRWFDKRRGMVLSNVQYRTEINRDGYWHGESSNLDLFDDIDEYLVEDIKMKTQNDKKVSSEIVYKDFLTRLKRALGKVHFIKEQRLIKQRKMATLKNEIVNVIEDLPNSMSERIRNISSSYSATANRLDSTYPYRLFNNEVSISEEEYQHKMLEMTNKFEKLRKYDISEIQNSDSVVFKPEHAKALKVYFDDFDEKYSVYKNFITKLDLFTDIINNRLTFKKIKISRRDGISIMDETDINNKLSLNDLSSGEKQEIVLFYDLIFAVEKDVLLLIDEPEISLHITWQKKFMDDLLKIVMYKGLKVIVATHSPQIINNHWDIQVDLGELYGNELNKE